MRVVFGNPIEAETWLGDVIWFSRDDKHWHHASATTTKLVIQERLDGKTIDWIE
jgi:quercetin dioxygenase-like cupin family protein